MRADVQNRYQGSCKGSIPPARRDLESTLENNADLLAAGERRATLADLGPNAGGHGRDVVLEAREGHRVGEARRVVGPAHEDVFPEVATADPGLS